MQIHLTRHMRAATYGSERTSEDALPQCETPSLIFVGSTWHGTSDIQTKWGHHLKYNTNNLFQCGVLFSVVDFVRKK